MAELPYTPRPGQTELVDAVANVQRSGGHLLVEAPTGLGKTVCALTASLRSRSRDGRRILYVTRTNSQQTQVLRELDALRDAGQDPGTFIPMMGRRHYCPLFRDDERYRDGTPEELGRLCRDAKRKAEQEHQTGQRVRGACPYFRQLLEDGPEPVAALLDHGGLDGGEVAGRVAEAGSCPYEALKQLLPQADGVILPMVFVLDDRLRQAVAQWLGCGLDECHLILDEAHQLPEAARSHHSPRLSLNALVRAQREAEEFDDPVLLGRLLATGVVDALMRTVYGLVDEFVHPAPEDEEPDGVVPADALAEALMHRLRLTSVDLGRLAGELQQWGEIVREDRRSKGRLPRSHLGALGAFLDFWVQSRDMPYVHLATGGANPAVEAYLLEPAAILGWLEEFWSTTHQSGTLQPLEEHAHQCGLQDRVQRLVLPSPFAADRLRLVGFEGVDRRHRTVRDDPGAVARQQALARGLLQRMPGRTGCFFPSHAMLEAHLEEGFLHGLGLSVHRERRGQPTPELARTVQAFRSDPSDRPVLLGVLGGRLTEGLDYPGDAMENIVVMGIPYPRPTARNQALIQHHDRRHGKGWEYAVHNPTARTLRQAIGRLIRGPEDRGRVVVLDERVVRFRTLLPHLEMVQEVDQALAEPEAVVDGFVAATGWPPSPRRHPDGRPETK